MPGLEETIAPSIHIPSFCLIVKCNSRKKERKLMSIYKFRRLAQKQTLFLVIITIVAAAVINEVTQVIQAIFHPKINRLSAYSEFLSQDTV